MNTPYLRPAVWPLDQAASLTHQPLCASASQNRCGLAELIQCGFGPVLAAVDKRGFVSSDACQPGQMCAIDKFDGACVRRNHSETISLCTSDGCLSICCTYLDVLSKILEQFASLTPRRTRRLCSTFRKSSSSAPFLPRRLSPLCRSDVWATPSSEYYPLLVESSLREVFVSLHAVGEKEQAESML